MLFSLSNFLKKIFLVCFFFVFFNTYCEAGNLIDNYFLFSNKSKIEKLKSEFDEASSLMSGYILKKYKVKQYLSSEYHQKLCGAMIYNCFNSNRLAYFLKYRSYFEKYGNMYFGLNYLKYKAVIESIPQCESGFQNIVSKDGGKGLFQLTNKNFKQNFLLPEYNIMYGIHVFKEHYIEIKSAFDNIDDFKLIYLTLRSQNGSSKQIFNVVERYDNQEDYIITGNFILAHEKTGRFICYERVNTAFPIKVFITAVYMSDNLY